MNACVRVSGTLCNRALRMAKKEFLQHSKESRGVLGQASKQQTLPVIGSIGAFKGREEGSF